MLEQNPLSMNELQASLESVRKLRQSTTGSIVLMLLGLVVIAVSLVYSITRLRPLEQQIAQKQNEIKVKNAEFTELQTKVGEAQKQLDDLDALLAQKTKELEVKNEALRQAAAGLQAIAAGQTNPAEQATRTLKSMSAATVILDHPGPVILAPRTTGQSLENTKWNYQKGSVHYEMQFLPNGRYRYKSDQGRWFDGTWAQRRQTVTIITSNGAERETGTISGNRMSGQGRDVDTGGAWVWTATKIN